MFNVVCSLRPAFARAARLAPILALASFPAVAAAPGDFDTTFGGGAEVVSFDLVTDGSDVGQAVAFLPDGALVVVGPVQNSTEGSSPPSDFGFVKIGANGVLSSPWGTIGNGRSTVGFDSKFLDYVDQAAAVAVDSAGRIVAVGSSYDGGFDGSSAVVVRLSTIGTPDPDFTGDGKLFAFSADYLIAVDVDNTDAILIAGDAYGSFPDFSPDARLSKLAPISADDANAYDQNFGTSGSLTFFNESVVDLIALPDDRILLVTLQLGLPAVRLRQLTEDGDPDLTFGGGDGLVDLDLSNDGFANDAFDVALGPDGKVVMLGTFVDPDLLWVLARVLPNGSFDSSFGSQGVASFGYDVALTYTPRALAVQSDGRIVVVGDEPIATVVRFDQAGALDTTFYPPNGGRTFGYEEPTDQSWADAVAIGADGRIVIAGSSTNENDLGNRNFAVARLESGVVFCDGFESEAIYGESRWSSTAP